MVVRSEFSGRPKGSAVKLCCRENKLFSLFLDVQRGEAPAEPFGLSVFPLRGPVSASRFQKLTFGQKMFHRVV